MAHLAKITHMSDFHFMKRLTARNRIYYWISKLKIVANPHCFAKVKAISTYYTFNKIIDKSKGKEDILVISGDLTTNGRPESFDTAIQFVENSEIREGATQRLLAFGLNAAKDKYILVPGNHDRYGRTVAGIQDKASRVYEDKTGAEPSPFVRCYRPSKSQNSESDPAIIFFVFDSTLPSFADISNPIYQSAQGFITKEDCEWLTRECLEIMSGKDVKLLDGHSTRVNFARCVRIAILHHDPFENDPPLKLLRGEGFVDTCSKLGIDVVLYGHTHKSSTKTITAGPQDNTSGMAEILMKNVRPNHKTFYICAPSATEYYSDAGFFVYDIAEKSIEITEHSYDGVAFSAKKTRRRVPFTR